jgi:hypothetical protein
MTKIATLFHQLTLGVYVVGVANAGQRDGFTAAWVMHISSALVCPLQCLLSTKKSKGLLDRRSKELTLIFMAKTQLEKSSVIYKERNPRIELDKKREEWMEKAQKAKV